MARNNNTTSTETQQKKIKFTKKGGGSMSIMVDGQMLTIDKEGQTFFASPSDIPAAFRDLVNYDAAVSGASTYAVVKKTYSLELAMEGDEGFSEEKEMFFIVDNEMKRVSQAMEKEQAEFLKNNLNDK